MEDLGLDGEKPWSIERFGEAAYRFGRFNGHFTESDHWPDWPWLDDGQRHRKAMEGFTVPPEIVAETMDYWQQ